MHIAQVRKADYIR